MKKSLLILLLSYFVSVNAIIGSIEYNNVKSYLKSVNALKNNPEYISTIRISLTKLKQKFSLSKIEEETLLKIRMKRRVYSSLSFLLLVLTI